MSQDDELKRVRHRIGPAVISFAKHRISTNQKAFNIRELHDWVVEKTQIAPASPDRILRDLRQAGHFSYTVPERVKANYEFGQFFDPPRPGLPRSKDGRTVTKTIMSAAGPIGTPLGRKEKGWLAVFMDADQIMAKYKLDVETFERIQRQVMSTSVSDALMRPHGVQYDILMYRVATCR